MPSRWHDVQKGAAALVNGQNQCHVTKEGSDEQLPEHSKFVWGAVLNWIQKLGENGTIRVRIEYKSKICHIPNKNKMEMSLQTYL